jgi:hypothetical protein
MVLECSEAITAKRIVRKNKGVGIPTAQIVLTFYEELPTRVQIGWISCRVREFIPDPLRCFRCQAYGHTGKSCRGREKCSLCAGEHEWRGCPQANKEREERRPVCPNCSGSHSAAYRGCPKYQEAKEIIHIKISGKMSYAEAVRQWHHDAVERRQAEARPQPPNDPAAEDAQHQPPRAADEQPQSQPLEIPPVPTAQSTDQIIQNTVQQPAIVVPAPMNSTTITDQPQIPVTPRNIPPAPAARTRPQPPAAVHQGLPATITTPRRNESAATPSHDDATHMKTAIGTDLLELLKGIMHALQTTESRSELELLLKSLITSMYVKITGNAIQN